MTTNEKKTKIYTRCGDLGETGLLQGPRIGKDHPRIELLGALDELGAALGYVASLREVEGSLVDVLTRLQARLTIVGAETASLDPKVSGVKVVSDASIKSLERAIDKTQERAPQTSAFVASGGTPGAAALHLARTTCRRAERAAVALLRYDPKFSPRVVAWLNRLGDLLHLLALAENARAGREETRIDFHAAETEFDEDLL